MDDNTERLYQFGVHALGDMIQVGNSLVHAHTLQIFMNRDDALDLLVELAEQLKSDDGDIVAELKGWMLLVDGIQQGFSEPEQGRDKV